MCWLTANNTTRTYTHSTHTHTHTHHTHTTHTHTRALPASTNKERREQAELHSHQAVISTYRVASTQRTRYLNASNSPAETPHTHTQELNPHHPPLPLLLVGLLYALRNALARSLPLLPDTISIRTTLEQPYTPTSTDRQRNTKHLTYRNGRV